MSENNRNKNEKFSCSAFGAEENSAASLGEKELNKYSNIATKMFHTGVLSPREMAFPPMA